MPTKDEADRLLAEAQALARRHGWQLGRADAADLAAEAVLRGLEHPPPDGQIRPWLSRIVRNLVVDRHRRETLSRSLAATPLEPPPPPATPEELALARERRAAVRRALRGLEPTARRTILSRFYVHGAARMPSPTPVTFRTRLHRGLVSLRRSLGGLQGWALPWRLLPAAINPAVLVVVLAAQPPAPAPTAAAPSVAQQRRAPAALAPPPAAPPRPQAAPRPPEPSPPPATITRAARAATPPPPRRFDFEDDEVAGEIQSPHQEVIVAPPRGPRPPSLIEIPGSFVAAVARSLDEL